MEQQISANLLMSITKNIGLAETLNCFCLPLDVKIPIYKKTWDEKIEILNLSTRSSNGLRRNGLETIGDTARQIMTEGGIENLRNIGKKSIAEIKTKMLIYLYSELTQNQKILFWEDVIQNNKYGR